MTNINTLAIRQALQSGGAAAETQLGIIAHSAGDEQLALVIEDLGAAEIAAIVEDADMTKPSIVHSFISPEQFIGAFNRLGAKWGAITPSSDIDLLTFQNDIEDFLCPMILASGVQKHRDSLLAALLEHPLGPDTLLFVALGRKDSEELILRPADYPIAHGTWQELFRLTSELQPEAFSEIAHHSVSLTDGDRDETRPFAISHLNALHQQAREAQADEPEETEEVFVDL